MLRLAVIGSTGSIGTSTLEVVRQHPDKLEVVALAAQGRHLDLLRSQIVEFQPAIVGLSESAGAFDLRSSLPSGTQLVVGDTASTQAATHDQVDRVVAAMVGTAGVAPVAAALAAGKDVALANKEALVVAGPILLDLAERVGCELLPIDSEHVALHQALRCGRRSEVSSLTLTASGGPFLDRPRRSWSEITPEEATTHPTWTMGSKISVDSATLMNKGLELIEACLLFEIDQSRVHAVIHPQSLIHSLVEYRDGSWIAQLAINDMVIPIQYALSYPERWSGWSPPLSLAEIGNLRFLKLDETRFRSVALARDAVKTGGSAPAALNAANEVAVAEFLARRAPFTAIIDTVEEVLSHHETEPLTDIEQTLDIDRQARRAALLVLDRHR